jgi:hypothetical protein
VLLSPEAAKKEKMAQGSAQRIEKASFGQGNQKIFFDFLWRNLAGLGKIWGWLWKTKSAPPSAPPPGPPDAGYDVPRRRAAPREGPRLGVAEKGAQAIERFE